jgi:hypothetical protein
MAAKKTSELIPLCHPIALSKAEVAFEPDAARPAIRILATAKTTGPTGVEMEALTAAGVAALTIYDMIKAVDKAAHIDGLRLLSKSGGKSGPFAAPSAEPKRAYRSTGAKPRIKPATLMGEVVAPKPQMDVNGRREAFRTFMTTHRLRATQWAKDAGVPVSEIYAFLTGRSRAMPADVADRLARAARVKSEDMFR